MKTETNKSEAKEEEKEKQAEVCPNCQEEIYPDVDQDYFCTDCFLMKKENTWVSFTFNA